uniref:hypothetical chloroplast RF1 n=1 Tax=Interfilum massjukiae TaxID=519236 RepID=UPI00286C74DB|nr:hypothetical chloroplast RF1 [Interfilum massjukiae]YP_010932490.1 hypothetical chloroplast RF1 [Interfilum massjukiae]WKT06041.1 hypothetical chloroplast RF1 [Interfilum massjukiae]WKT06042.1 hypothetical chloroplast RF1 [Interfilum massjukiae]
MNPIPLNVYHLALYTVGAVGGWLSANPVLCIGIVYGFMGTQSVHVVHVLAARAFYLHGNLIGGVCVSSMLLGQAVLVTIEFLGWSQALSIRWRYNAAFVTAISLSMCLLCWIVPRNPISAPHLRQDIHIFKPLVNLPRTITSLRDPRVLVYSVLCASLYVLIPRGGASFANDLTSILGFSHGTKPAFFWGTLLGYVIGDLLFYASLFLIRPVTSLVTKREVFWLLGPFIVVLNAMVYATVIMQFRTDSFRMEYSFKHLSEARTQALLLAQDRASDWVPNVAKQRLNLYGRVYQVEEEMSALNQLLLRSLVDEKNSLQSVNLLPDLCEQPVLAGLEAQIGILPAAGLSPSLGTSLSEAHLKQESLLREEGVSLLEKQSDQLEAWDRAKGEQESMGGFGEPKNDLAIQPPYEKITPQEYVEESRGFAFPWEKKQLARHLGPLSLPKGRALRSWHAHTVGSKAEKPWPTALSLYEEEQEAAPSPRKESNTGWEKAPFLPTYPENYERVAARKRQKNGLVQQQRKEGLLPKVPATLKLLPWYIGPSRKPRWGASVKKRLVPLGGKNATKKIRQRFVRQSKWHLRRRRKRRMLKRRLRGIPIKQQRRNEWPVLHELGTALQPPNGILLTHVPLQATSEQVRELFEGHALERLRRVFQLWERRSTSNALLLFKHRTKGWFNSEDAYQDVVQRLVSPSEALFDYCVRLMAYAQHQRAFACVIRPQTHLAWAELDRAPRLCLSMIPGLPRTRPAYQVQERIADIYAYLYGEEEEADDMMEELTLPFAPEEEDNGSLATLRLRKAQMLTILESRMLRQRAEQGRRVPLRLESEGRLIPPSSVTHSLRSWAESFLTHTTGFLTQQILRRNSSDATSSLRPTRPLHTYAQGQRWASSSDARLPTGPPGQFPFLLVPRLLEALNKKSLQPSQRRLPFPQLRSLVQAPGLKSSRLGPRPVCHRPGLLSRSMDPITANIVATTPAPQGPVDRARRQALRKQALFPKHQARKLEWAIRKIARTLDQCEQLPIWTRPSVSSSAHPVPLLDRLIASVQSLWRRFKAGLNGSMRQATEKEVREAPWSPQSKRGRQDRPEVLDLRLSLHSLRQVVDNARLGPAVPWILHQASFYAKEKEMVKAAWRTLYAKSGTWVGSTPSLSPLPMTPSASWHHKRARIQLHPFKRTVRGEPHRVIRWPNLIEIVERERSQKKLLLEQTAPHQSHENLDLESAPGWVGPLEKKVSNLWRKRTPGAKGRGHRMLLAVHRSKWDKRSLLYNPLPPLLGKTLRTEQKELTRLSSKKQPSQEVRSLSLLSNEQALIAKQNRQSNLRLMLTHSLRLTSLRLYQQEGRKALASLAGLGPLPLFADDERVLALVRLDDSSVDPSLRKRAWGARYRLALGRMLGRGNKQRYPLESLEEMRRRTHRYRAWDSMAQKHIPQHELAKLGFSERYRQGQALELFPPGFSFGDELERSQVTLGLFDTGIKPYERGAPTLAKRNSKKDGPKRPTRSKDRPSSFQGEGKVPESMKGGAYQLPMDKSERVNSPSFLFKPEPRFVSLDDLIEYFGFIQEYAAGEPWFGGWKLWWSDVSPGDDTFLAPDGWRIAEEEMDERDDGSSLPFRKIFHSNSQVEARNPSRARIVAEEWFAQSTLPPGERRAYLDEQKARIEEVEMRKQSVIPSLKDRGLRRGWHSRLSRSINRVTKRDRWIGLVSKSKHHYPLGPIARFYLGHSGLPEERALGHVPMDPHIDDPELEESGLEMPEVVTEVEKQHMPRLSRWGLGELRSRIETDDMQEGVRKDIMRRAWERGDAAKWAARSGSPPDLEAILEYEEERANEQSGTERLHTSTLDQVTIRDLYLMKRMMRRLRFAFRLASLHLQSSWLKSSNPQRMRRPTQFEKAWAWRDFWRFHGVSYELLNPEDTMELDDPVIPMDHKPHDRTIEKDHENKAGKVPSMKDLLDAAESLTFWGTNRGEKSPPAGGLKPLKEPGFLRATVRFSSEPLAQSMNKALSGPFLAKPLLPNQRDRLRGLRARQAYLVGRCKPDGTLKQKALAQNSLKAQRIQPASDLKDTVLEEGPDLQSWQPKAPVHRLGLSAYLVGVRRHIEWSQGHQPFLPYLRTSLGLVGPSADRPNTRARIKEESFWSAEMLPYQDKEFFPTYEHRSPWRQLWDDMFGRESMQARPNNKLWWRRRRLRPGFPPDQISPIGQRFLKIPRIVKTESSRGRGVGPASIRQYKYYPTVLEAFYRNTRHSKRKRKLIGRRIRKFAKSFHSDVNDRKKSIPINDDNPNVMFILNTAYETFQKQPDWDLLRRGISFVMDMEALLRFRRRRPSYDLRHRDPRLIILDKYSRIVGGVWLGKFADVFTWIFRAYFRLFQGFLRSFLPMFPNWSSSKVGITFVILGKPQLIYQPSNKGFFSWHEYDHRVRHSEWNRIPSFIGLRERASHFADHMIAVRVNNPFQTLQIVLQAFLRNPLKALTEIEVQTYILARNEYDILNYYHKLRTRVYRPDNSAEGLRKYYSLFIPIREAVTKQLWSFFGITRVPYHDLPFINKRVPHYYIKTYGQVPGVEPWWLGIDLQGYDWVMKAGSSRIQSRYSHPIVTKTDLEWQRLQMNDPIGFERLCTLADTTGKRRARGLPHYTSIKDFTFVGHLLDSDHLMTALRRKAGILDDSDDFITALKSKAGILDDPKIQHTDPERNTQEPQPERKAEEILNNSQETNEPENVEYQEKEASVPFTSGLIRRSLALWKRLAPDPSRQRLLRRMTKIRRRALGHKLHLWVERLWQHSSYNLQVPLPLLSKLGQDLSPNQSYTEGVVSRLKALKQREREGRQFALGQERAGREALASLIQVRRWKEWSSQAHHEATSLRHEKPAMMGRVLQGNFKGKAHTLCLHIQGNWSSLVYVARFFVLRWRQEGWKMLSPWRQAKLWHEVGPLWKKPSSSYGLIPAQGVWASKRIMTRQQSSLQSSRGTLSWAEEGLPFGSVGHGLVRQVQAMASLASLRDVESTVAMAVLEGSRLLHQDSPDKQALYAKLYLLERKRVERAMSLAFSFTQVVEDRLSRRKMTKIEKNALESCKRCLERATSCLAQSAILNPQEVWQKDSISLEEWAVKWQPLVLLRSGSNLEQHSTSRVLKHWPNLSRGEREVLLLKQKSVLRDKIVLWRALETERLVRGTCSAAFQLSQFQRQRLVVLFQGLALEIHTTDQALQNARRFREPMSLTKAKRLWSRRAPILREGETLRSMPVRLREAALVCLQAAPKSALSSSMEAKINRRLRLYARHRKGILQAYRESQKALERILLDVPEAIERAVTGLRESRAGLEEALGVLRLYMGTNRADAGQVEANGAWVREEMARLMVALYDLSLPSRQLARILQQEATQSMPVPVPSLMLHAPRETRRMHTPWGLAVRSLPKVEIPLEVEWQLRTLSKEVDSLSHSKHLEDQLSLERGARLGLLDLESNLRLEKLRQELRLHNHWSGSEGMSKMDQGLRMVNLAEALAYVKKISTSQTSPAQIDLVKPKPGKRDVPPKLEADYSYYGVEAWDSSVVDRVCSGNMLMFDQRGERSEHLWAWGINQTEEDLSWSKNEESAHMEFLHWHAVQDIRAWRALMANALCKPAMLNIHTPLDPILFMGPVQPQGLPPSLHCPLAKETDNPEMWRIERIPRFSSPRHEQENQTQAQARDIFQPLPRMKVRTLGWAMGVVQRRFVYSPPLKHTGEEDRTTQESSRDRSRETRQGISRWQCQVIGPLDQPHPSANTLVDATWMNRLASQVPREVLKRPSQRIYQLMTWAGRVYFWLQNQIKAWFHLPGELFQRNASRAQHRPQQMVHPLQTSTQAQPTWKWSHSPGQQPLQVNDERQRLLCHLPANEVSVSGQDSVAWGVERNKQDQLFASEALLTHMLSSGKQKDKSNLLQSKKTVSLGVGQEEQAARRRYERQVRHIGNRLPEPVPLQPFFSQWMDLQVSKVKGYESGPSVARTMPISTKDLYMTSMGTLARPMAHQMSYSFHGLPEPFIQKAMYSLRTWRASPTWWRVRNYFPENPYQQTWREKLKPLSRYLRDGNLNSMFREWDDIWRIEMAGRKVGQPASIRYKYLLNKYNTRFEQWARNQAHRLIPTSLWHRVPKKTRSSNNPKQNGAATPLWGLLQHLKDRVRSMQAWMTAYLQRSLDTFFSRFGSR